MTSVCYGSGRRPPLSLQCARHRVRLRGDHLKKDACRPSGSAMALFVVANCLQREIRSELQTPPASGPTADESPAHPQQQAAEQLASPGSTRGRKMGAVSGSTAICFAIPRSVVAATRCQSTFERSRSALVRRTIGITLSPISHAQTDDPSTCTAIRVYANQNLPCGATDCLYSLLAILAPSVRALQCRSVEQSHCDLEGKASGPRVSEALRLVPFEDHR